MPSTQDFLSLLLYAPALTNAEKRSLAMVHGVEHALPGLRLEWTTSERGDLISLNRRDDWVMANTLDGGLPFLCDDNEQSPVTLYGLENPGGPGEKPQFEVHMRLPINEFVIGQAEPVLAALGESGAAWWGELTPFTAAADIAEQTAPTLDGPPVPPRGLPVLMAPGAHSPPELPSHLGWVNYWSDASARALGFPDPSRDAELLSRARRTATNGWVVRLTDEPLDLDRPAHLDALLRSYERFPKIGGR
ncbi:hypothetical protein D7X55_21405 [Corallococcus sp. AB049A]|uniref:DUF5953 family protein n=1 Tax=Corallococcus sp. AB049A TaxID=2316721 RepID=UPI000EE8AA3D|nr:DUF5953 family protein [Corallococcus sp. AB049A]RKI62992.1 hypothetical protein D7X55_21405 [Corallococcus sp. AB049A]